MTDIWVHKVIGSMTVRGESGPRQEPLYGPPQKCRADSLVYAMECGYVQCDAPGPESATVVQPEPRQAEVSADGWPTDAPRERTRRKAK